MSSTPKKLKIAILLRRFVATGGAERYAVEITQRIGKIHEVHVFCHEHDSSLCEGLHIHRVPRFLKKPGYINQLLFSFSCYWKTKGMFDIVHSHERVSFADATTIHCPCYRNFLTRGKTPLRRFFDKIRTFLSPRHFSYLWLEKKQFSVGPLRKIIAVSEWVKKDVQRHYPLKDPSFSIVYPGVDRDKFKHHSEPLKKKSETFILLFVGTEFQRKGLNALLASLLQVSFDIELWVAGAGRIDKYQKIAQNLGVADRVKFLGLVDDIASVYQKADAFILPTLREPCGMSSMEAMISGLPTAVSQAKYAGISELIQNREAILIHHPESPEDIAKAITQLHDSELSGSMANRGMELARNLTWERSAERTLEVYEEILALRQD